jgi:hypothetical protein
MASELIAGLGLLKTAFDMAKGLKDISDATIRNGAVIELQEMILSAQQQQSALIERVRELEKEVARFETWEAEKQRYELKEVPGLNHVLAYTLKPEAQSSEPPHWICTNCYENRKRSILQPEERVPGRAKVLVCNNCGSDFYVTGLWEAAHSRTKPSRRS